MEVQPSTASAPGGAGGRLALLPVSAIALLLAVAIAAATYRYPPPSGAFVLLGLAGATGILALAVARYDAAVAIGFLLLGVVRVEPAPPDAVFTAVMAVAAVTGRFRLTRVPVVVFGALGVFLSLSILSSVDAVDANRAAFFLSITLYLGAFSLWLTGYLDSTWRARLIVRMYLIAAVSAAALGTLALFVPVPGQGSLTAYEVTRATGLFKDPNVFGPFLIPAILVVLEEMWRPRLLSLRNPTKLLGLLVLMLGVLFSYSRAAWLNLAIGVTVLVLVLTMREGRAGRVSLIVAAVLAASAATAGTIALTGSSAFLEQRAGAQPYDVRRFDAQDAGLALAQRHPVGIGPGQFEPVVQYAAHSTYIRAFAEQGILGLLAILILVGSTLIMAMGNSAAGRSTYGIGSAALLASWCGLVVNSVFVDTLHWRHLWMIAAMIWVGRSLRPERTAEVAPDAARGALW